MSEVFVGKFADFEMNDRRIIRHGELEIGVLKRGETFHAYSNYCLHQGGPACEGLFMARVDDRLDDAGRSLGLAFSTTETHFVCPWHGVEYDFSTGECVFDRRRKLERYDVLLRDGDVFVRI
jgi:nitrite reductase/ring-hydroxylating ferredoxin subunit